jgi:hypothetical protein
VDRLAANGALEADWRAVESGRPPVTGSRAADRRDGPARELTQARELALPGEVLPQRPAGLVNGQAAVAAHAESVPDGVQEELRRRLFAAIGLEARPMTSVTDVPRQVTPALLAPDTTVMLGEDALRYLSRRSILAGLG